MPPTLKTTLLGAALAAATPITHNAGLPQQNTVSLATILLDGVAPVFMAQVADPAAESKKCNLDLYLACMSTGGKDCGPLLNMSGECNMDDLIELVIGNLPPHVDISFPITVNGSTIVIGRRPPPRPVPWHGNRGPEVNDTRNASAPALERRQASLCPKHCAAWAAIPPFGLWFGVCVGDCNLRCNRRGQHCP